MKKILFLIPADGSAHTLWDGSVIRTGGVGVSGTHQSTVIAAEQLVRAGHQVCVMNYCNDVEVNGVRYISSLQELGSVEDIECAVVPPWFGNVQALCSVLKHLKHVVVWFHCPFLSVVRDLPFQVRHALPGAKVSFMHVSEWSRMNVLKEVRPELMALVHKQMTTPNALMVDVMPPVDEVVAGTRPNNFVFFACFERGGKVAQRVHAELVGRGGSWAGSSFITSQYGNKGTQSDKTSLMAKLRGARYFVYPLVLPPEGAYSVHRDTFGCVVAEALAMGVEVITYPVAALGEYYGKEIHAIPFPEGITRSTFDDQVPDPLLPQLYSDAQVKIIADMVARLDETWDSAERRDKRAQDACRVRERYGPEAAGIKWTEFVRELETGVAPSSTGASVRRKIL